MTENIDFLVSLSPDEKKRDDELKARHGISDEEKTKVMTEAMKQIFGKKHCAVGDFLGLEESL